MLIEHCIECVNGWILMVICMQINIPNASGVLVLWKWEVSDVMCEISHSFKTDGKYEIISMESANKIGFQTL